MAGNKPELTGMLKQNKQQQVVTGSRVKLNTGEMVLVGAVVLLATIIILIATSDIIDLAKGVSIKGSEHNFMILGRCAAVEFYDRPEDWAAFRVKYSVWRSVDDLKTGQTAIEAYIRDQLKTGSVKDAEGVALGEVKEDSRLDRMTGYIKFNFSEDGRDVASVEVSDKMP